MKVKVKKVLVLVFLIGLVVWGMYDVGKSKTAAPQAKPDTTSAQVNKDSAQQQPAVGQPAVGLLKGDLAPDFQLKTIDGKDISLSGFRGKKVILNIWATWCPPCQEEMPDIEKFYAANKNSGVVVLSVNLTVAEKNFADVPNFIKQYGLTFPVVLDVNGQVAQMYGASAIPTSYIIDSSGIIRQKMVGPMSYDMMSQFIANDR